MLSVLIWQFIDKLVLFVHFFLFVAMQRERNVPKERETSFLNSNTTCCKNLEKC